jgi:hypothetical protein
MGSYRYEGSGQIDERHNSDDPHNDCLSLHLPIKDLHTLSRLTLEVLDDLCKEWLASAVELQSRSCTCQFLSVLSDLDQIAGSPDLCSKIVDNIVDLRNKCFDVIRA